MKRKALLIKYRKNSNILWLGIIGYVLILLMFVWGLLFFNGVITLGGVPASIVVKFVQDPKALTAFFLGNGRQLHNRLESLGIEEDIKEYYRPQIPDEVELDRYIHQLLYDRTGYLGYNYWANSQGMLVLKKSGEYRILRELRQKALKEHIIYSN